MINRRNMLRAGVVAAGVAGGVAVTAGAASAAASGKGWVSVLDHYRDAQGQERDDAGAIQAAINAATAMRPVHSVLVPPGEYVVNREILVRGLNDAVISGHGATLTLTGAAATTAGASAVLKITDSERFEVSGLTVVDNERTQPYNGVSIARSSRGTLNGVSVYGVKWTGLGVFDTTPGASKDIALINCTVVGTRFGISTNGHDVRIIGNHVAMYWPSTAEAAAKGGVWSAPSDYYDGINVLSGSDRTTVTGNTITECGQAGVYTQDCTNLVVSANTVTGCQLRGIEVDGGSRVAVGVTVSGNTVVDCKGQINLVRARDVSVVGNRLANTSAARASSLIAVNVGSSHVSVVGNHATQAHPTFPAVYVIGDATDVTVAANEVVAGTPYQAPASVALLYRSAAGEFTVGGRLLATKGLGVGNAVAAATPGKVVSKIEVFSASGASLGFVPVYQSIA
ncbi:right-handed parallel beta-helix repeat-containing protein [Actinoplanes philippinensis]|uniref:right-handed parallel beta-helix repeat-containing protein n=1 Tax=Actinoplanes philippinensis TaxID=35752 RepID=UPI0033D9741F